MPLKNVLRCLPLAALLATVPAGAQNPQLIKEAEAAMLRSTRYMVEEVSTQGGYVWYYLPDLSRRWGEMEAYKTMVWTQDGGTVGMGHLFLDAYRATKNEYYYTAAEKAAAALIWGQSAAGGWNYMIDFAGDRSLKKWYATIGRNGWRLEEFQHYYGNDTYDDDVTSDAARFLLRLYLEKLDPKYKPALDKAIGFVLKSQYPSGGWPQRYPLKFDFNKNGHPDYTSFNTFNDDVIWENVNFLIQCYLTLGEERFLEPIHRGMNFYVLSQTGSGGWAQQYDGQLKPAGARTYEPAALLPRTTFGNALLLLRFYQYTGDRKFLARVPDAIAWLEKTRLPQHLSDGGRYTHPTFIDVDTGKPLFVHRKGSNAAFGFYYVDTNDQKLLAHYGGKTAIPVERLKEEYRRISALPVEEATKASPLRPQPFDGQGLPQGAYPLNRAAGSQPEAVTDSRVREVLGALDSRNRWLVKHAMISNPYTGDGQQQAPTEEYATSHAGDKTDTSPYRDPSDQLYISTAAYIRNMTLLMDYIKAAKPAPSGNNKAAAAK
ncbi:pectate lyase [Paraflavisolibacter sp. H34]|uniref:pectate lyase n=1 Tax=Huijunlia imazamoxiresistens TaxID=3127457 RepID=UPI003018D549